MARGGSRMARAFGWFTSSVTASDVRQGRLLLLGFIVGIVFGRVF